MCDGCAQKGKRKVRWHFGIDAGLVAIASSFMVAGEGLVPMVLFPAFTTSLMAVAAVRLMKLANRKVQRRIAGGDFPEFDALTSAEGADIAMTVGAEDDPHQLGG